MKFNFANIRLYSWVCFRPLGHENFKNTRTSLDILEIRQYRNKKEHKTQKVRIEIELGKKN